MGKYQYWQIDNDEIVNQHVITATPDAVKKEKVLGFFKFTIQRYKDQNTQREQLEISAEVQEQPSGKIVTNLIDMENDMPKLRAYGVVLARTKYVELSHLLSDKYYYFDPILTGKMDNIVTASVADEIFEMFCQYIADTGISTVSVKNVELYNIPLKDFHSELSDSKFKSYNPTEVKEVLFNQGFTVANKGKFDYVVSVENNKVKMISFKKECVEPILEKLKAEQ